jgi:hypothetical protein
MLGLESGCGLCRVPTEVSPPGIGDAKDRASARGLLRSDEVPSREIFRDGQLEAAPTERNAALPRAHENRPGLGRIRGRIGVGRRKGG